MFDYMAGGVVRQAQAETGCPTLSLVPAYGPTHVAETGKERIRIGPVEPPCAGVFQAIPSVTFAFRGIYAGGVFIIGGLHIPAASWFRRRL